MWPGLESHTLRLNNGGSFYVYKALVEMVQAWNAEVNGSLKAKGPASASTLANSIAEASLD